MILSSLALKRNLGSRPSPSRNFSRTEDQDSVPYQHCQRRQLDLLLRGRHDNPPCLRQHWMEDCESPPFLPTTVALIIANLYLTVNHHRCLQLSLRPHYLVLPHQDKIAFAGGPRHHLRGGRQPRQGLKKEQTMPHNLPVENSRLVFALNERTEVVEILEQDVVEADMQSA